MRVLRYPATVTNVEGNNIPYKSCDYIENITNDTENYACWGYPNPGPRYSNAIAGRNGSRKHPSTIRCSNFQFPIPENAKISSIIVEYSYRKKSYSNETAHGSFASPKVTLNPFGVQRDGNAPAKNDFGVYQVRFDNLNVRGRDINDPNFHILFDLPANTSTNPCYIQMKFFRVYVDYTSSNYVPSVEISPTEMLYPNEARVKLSVQETSGLVASEQVPISLPPLPNFEYRGLPFDVESGTFMLVTENHKAECIFSIKPTSNISGLFTLNFRELISNHSAEASFIVKTPKVEVWDFYFNNEEVEMSRGNARNISTLHISLYSEAVCNMVISFDMGGLKVDYASNGFNTSNNTFTISEKDWIYDTNVGLYLYESRIDVYGLDDGVFNVSMNSNLFLDTYSTSLKVTLPDLEDLYYSMLQISDFTLDNLVDGERYVFSCLCRLTGQRLYHGQRNTRASINNGGEIFTNQLTITNEWEELKCEFEYNKDNPTFITFYGNYLELDEGVVEFGNPCLILKDKYAGYEYPVFSLNPKKNLIQDKDYSHVVLNPPEHPITTKHFFSDMDFQGIEDSNVLIHGIEISGDISTTEPVNLICGLGTIDDNEIDYYVDSSFITSDTSKFHFGGKFQSFGIPFVEINSLLNKLRFYLQIDDGFDNITPFDVNMKNTVITLYYSLNTGEDCDFYINEVPCKYYFIMLNPETEIPRGANFDAKTYEIEGADGEYPTRVNIENKKIKLKFFVYGDDFRESTELMKYISEYIYPERDHLDDPVLKSISFFFDREHCYDYYIEDAIEAEPKVGGYECSVDLIVPSGLNRTIKPIQKSFAGTITTIGKVKPEIYFYKLQTSQMPGMQIIDSESERILTLEGEFIENIPEFTKFKIDCETRKIYYEQYGEWFIVDPNCIGIDSTFFIIDNHFNFEGSVNCKVTAVKYYEYGG